METRIFKKRTTISMALIVVLFIVVLVAVAWLVTMGLPSKDMAAVVDATKESSEAQTPVLETREEITGLDRPWEVAFLPSGEMLITERSGDISKVTNGQKTVVHRPDDMYARGEGGMMGLAVDPKFAQNRYVYACFNSSKGSPDVRVVRWKVSAGVDSLGERKDIITGVPSAQSGRHSGCRVGFGADDALWVGTGDAAQSANPQDLKNLGGKILRTDREGKGISGNLGGQADPRVYSYGHRNTQGLAFYAAEKNGSYGVSIEHGSAVDDEVNPLKKGNFGWAPLPPYNELVPMTDTNKFPDAIKSIWSSGNPTIAPSDADFITGEKWGVWQGRLAMGVLKDKHLRLLELKDDGVTGEQLKLFDQQFGRIRAVTMHTNGSLYLTTDNGNSQDKIIKVTPKS